MKNKIGFNLLVWSAIVSDEMLPIMERLKKIGYDGIECSMGSADNAAYKRIGEQAKALGLEINPCLAVGAEHNPVSDSASVREKALDQLKWAIDRGADMESTLICGPFHSAFATFTQKPPQSIEYERSAEVLRKAGDYAAQANIVLALEAINRFECYLCNTMEQVTGLANLVDHSHVKVMYDTHHANLEEKGIEDAIDLAAPLLHHVHISENDRGTPGDGHNPWDETFAALAKHNYPGWLTIEAFTRNDPDFANAINVWREYSAPWDMAERGYTFIKNMGEKHGL